MAADESSIVFEMGQPLATMTGIHDHQADAVRRLNLAQVQALRRFYWQRMALEFGDQVMRRPLIDKHALNTIDLGLISVVFPAAKILFAVRDPRDICISCFMQPFAPSPATINLLSWQGIAQQYAAVMDYWLHLRPLCSRLILNCATKTAWAISKPAIAGFSSFSVWNGSMR